MTAPKGTPSFGDEKQRKQEKRHVRLVREVYEEFKSKDDKWHCQREYSLVDFLGEENVINARRMDGSSNTVKSDGGFIFYDGKLVGVAEDKHQKTFENACERAWKYAGMYLLKPYQIFITCGGKGYDFDLTKRSGRSTATMYDSMVKHGYWIAKNETNEEIKTRLRDWFKQLL